MKYNQSSISHFIIYLPMLKVKDEMTIKFYNVSKHVKQQNKLEQ